ncbi:MAG: hypothetical protein LC768_16010 [Acidobacteria bacterium]|nr:hypothetical protein [Acidobacteriota bacterium]MCA1639805.1 hypothetical protein [Acidobacteriota bacterium]
MQQFSLRIFIGILTFFFGVSIVMFWYFRPNLHTSTDKPILPQSQAISDESKSAWQTLLSFENQDLRKLDKESKARLKKASDVLIGKSFDDFRLISKISNSQGEIRYILIEESPLIAIPGDSRLRIYLFNPQGKLFDSLSFPSGWRIGLKGIRVIYKSEIGREVIEVESEPVINGRDIVEQYYALIGEKVLPIRLEDSRGKLVQNYYEFPNMTIGFTIVGRSAEEWKKALNSEDRAELLATLTWLNGIHSNPVKHSTLTSGEEINEARLVEEMHSQAEIKAVLKRLLQSDNAWIREAAKLPIESR